MRPLILELPEHYQASGPDAELQRALSRLVDQAQRDKDITLEQLFPSTASGWGLALWEEAYGIPVDKTQSDQQRRQRILGKIKGVGTTTVARILALAQVYWPQSQVVEIPPEYRFEIVMTGTAGNVPYLEDFSAAVNEMKPAHLDWAIKYRIELPSTVYVGSLPRQGDMILWKVDCRDDP